MVGMDIGGTNTVMGIVDRDGNILATDAVKTGQYERVEEYVEAVCAKLCPLMEKHGGVENFRGMGIGAPNANYYRLSGYRGRLRTCRGRGLCPWLRCSSRRRGFPWR